jgi:hypothetical protein
MLDTLRYPADNRNRRRDNDYMAVSVLLWAWAYRAGDTSLIPIPALTAPAAARPRLAFCNRIYLPTARRQYLHSIPGRQTVSFYKDIVKTESLLVL